MHSELILYQTEDGQTKIQTRLENETVWLSQAQMAELFGKARTTITEHLGNIFKEGELEENSVCRNFRHTANDGKTYDTRYYNLDVIISVGYRVKSLQEQHKNELSKVAQDFVQHLEQTHKQLKNKNNGN
ncbi:virulence RhuM family protein [Pedobacter glucosidilyticus]|uniref:virulence RhuM family protein n=1 Tax=Pedobacter glucosidilyticus TaxID=1122941 RepID=UPI0026ECF9CF|nr:RhuM family protein [Pedobacter glucosidilyticus]